MVLLLDRILFRSSRKCTVTGIDSHELQGLDVVQCAALVETNHGIVNLIMNEYACYGKGHTIHSSGQIEWFKNSVDDRSVQVGDKQRICTIDGDTFQRSFLANLKTQGLYDVADPDHDPENGDIYEKELFKGKQSFVYSVLVTSLQTEKGRELVKEFDGDARSIILKQHHYHTK